MMERTTGGRTGPPGNRCHFGGALAKKRTFQNFEFTREVGGWVQVSLGIFF